MRTVASVNPEISCLHHVFIKAVEWGMIERSSFDRGKKASCPRKATDGLDPLKRVKYTAYLMLALMSIQGILLKPSSTRE